MSTVATASVNEWTKVVTHPLGLVGFVLFLVFGLLARLKRVNERRWLFPAMIAMSAGALLGGLGLAYVQLRGSSSTAAAAPIPAPKAVKVSQKSSGAGSPNVQDVKGNVTINVDQSSGVKNPNSKDKKE
jgi:hypothetical protein